MNYYELVKEFHEAFVPDVVLDKPTVLSEERHELRMRLIREEWVETLKAIRDDDKEQILDGLCDLIYVLLGYAVEIGYEFDFSLSKESDNYGFVEFEMVGFDSIETAYYLADFDGVVFGLDEALCITLVYALQYFGSFPQAFAEVHRSNMAKLWTTKEVANYGFPKTHRYTFKESSKKGYHIAMRPDGKIMKPPSWTPPNLKQFL